MIQSKTTQNRQVWTNLLRIRVGQSIRHNGVGYVSVTGVNVEPGTTNDFEVLTSTATVGSAVVEKITVSNVEYTYIKTTETGTKDTPVQYDEAIGGVTNSTGEDGGVIKLYKSLIYNIGDPSLISSWWVSKEIELI